MGEAETLFDTGLRLLKEGKFYDAMTNFTKSYNISGNCRALYYSAEASFQYAMHYFKTGDMSGWDTFSNNAYQHFKIALDYADTEQLKSDARARMQKIKEMQDMAKGL
jgi:hypothetical protein